MSILLKELHAFRRVSTFLEKLVDLQTWLVTLRVGKKSEVH